MEEVERIHDQGFQPERAIAGELEGLNDRPAFHPVIDMVNTEGDLSRFISDLTGVAAAVYLANGSNLVAFVHAVTAPSALRILAPYVDDSSSRLIARYAWQACAAVYAWYSEAQPGPVDGFTAPSGSRDDLIDRALQAGGAHSLKFTEACLREYDVKADPVYLVAAWDACERVGNV